MAEPESVDLVDTLAQNWARAVQVAAGFVRDAEKAAALVYTTKPGPTRAMELETYLQLMADARGALAVLNTLLPDDPHLRMLWNQLNHCPVIMLAGPDRAAGGSTQQLRLIK